MSAPRVLITGGAGFVGLTIVQQLVERHSDWKLIVVDINPLDDEYAFKNGIDFVKIDLKDEYQCMQAVRDAQPTLVIHTAGRVPGGLTRYGRRGRDAVWDINVEGTRNMLKASKENGAQAFIYTGSCTSVTDDLDHEYPNFDETVPFPKKLLVYGETKVKDPGIGYTYRSINYVQAAAEELVIAANSEKMATCSLRPSTICGRNDYQLVPSIQACIEKWETPFVIGNDDNLYDFTFVDNVAHAHVLAAENLLTTKTAAGEAILISNDQPITFRDFMLAIWAQFDHVPPFVVTIPPFLAHFYGAVCEWLAWLRGRKTTLSRGSVKDAMGTRYANLDKARRLLGYAPIVDMWDAVRISCDALKIRMGTKMEPARSDGWGHTY